MNKKRTSSISHCKFSESSDDSEIDEIKEIRTNLSLLKKTLKKATNPRGQTPTPAKDKGYNTKDRPKSGKTDKANISMFDLGKGSSEKNEKSGALKKKRSSVRPLKAHDISVSGPGVAQKQLQDDHILKVKVNNLEKSIVSQEKALRNIRKKLITEKSDLWGLKERISQKEKLEQEEMRQERSFVVESKNEGNEKERKRLSIVRKKNKENKGLSGDELDMSKYQRNYFSEKTAEFGYRERREEASLAQELDREREERKRISEMKEYIRDLTRKYEIEIEGIKASINIVSEENYKIRSNAISMKDQETIEIMYDKKIRELEEALAKKDREIAEKEGYYKGQIEDIQIKIEELQREVRRMAKCEDEAEELAQQLQLKDKEMYMSKKYYMDKLQTKIDEQTNQKKEWLIVYNGLLSDIRNLKGDLEGYENKKMNSNDSSGRSKEELSFTSSRRIGQGNY